MNQILILLFLFLAEIIYFRIADKYNIVDKPNHRSSHTKVTLRGGGIIFYIAIIVYFILGKFQFPYFFAGISMISVIGFIDDVKPLSSRIRMSIQFLSFFLLFYEWDLFSMPWYITAISLILCTAILNIFNFMDGINGITGAYSIGILGTFWYINNYTVQFIDNEILNTVLLSLVVFNFYNFRKKAKCFAGDVGSTSMAFIIIFLLGSLIVKTGDISYIILLSVYGVDSLLTILQRLIQKENILVAHRKHLYQLLANEKKMPHLIVSGIYFLLQILIMTGYFLTKDHLCYLIIVVVVLILLYIYIKKSIYKSLEEK